MRPDFLVIGAGRSGTTALHHHLAAHPQVFVPRVKAPSHWYCVAEPEGAARRAEMQDAFVTDRDRYDALFADVPDGVVSGEVSPAYLASVAVPPVITAALPAVRLVAVLRDPVDRFVARWTARHRDGLERRSFADVVREEIAEGPARDASGTYFAAGFVHPVLEAYAALVPAERLHVLLHDDLVRDTGAAVAGVLDFLGVDPTVPIDVSRRHNASRGVVRGRVRRAVWTRSAGARAVVRPYVPERWRDAAFRVATRDVAPAELDAAALGALAAAYRDEVHALSDLIGRDLSTWRSW